MAQQSDSKGAEIIRHFNEAKAARLPLEPHIRKCYRYTFPIRGVRFTQAVTINPTTLAQQAETQQAEIFDSTAPDACTTVASNYQSGLTPANSKWFGYKLEGDDSDANEGNRWLDEKTTKLHAMIHASNFDASGFEGMMDTAVAGMFALFVEKGVDTPFHFDLWELANCYFAASRRGGRIDIVFYNFSLTAEQAVNEYGDQCPDRINKLAERSPQSRHAFVWCIRPRKVDKGKRQTARERLQPFEAYQVEVVSKTVVREEGFHEFPVIVPRYNKIPGSVYATGPFADALPDTQTINEVKRLSLAGLDMATSGMWGAVDDGVLNPKTVRIGARKVVYMAKKESFFALTPGGNPELTALKTEELRQSIRRVMNSDMLETKSEGPAETATAWHYRVNLIRQLLGPRFGRFQSEYLLPLVARCFGIALREGWFGAPGSLPPALKNQQLRLQFISPLARAQKLEDVAAMDRFEQDLAMTAKETGDLSVFDIYDRDAAKRMKADLLGVPTKLMVDEKDVKKTREGRSKALAAQKQQETLAAAASKAKPGDMSGMGGMPMAA